MACVCKIKTFSFLKIVYELILVFMGNRLMWANGTDPNISTISGIHCIMNNTFLINCFFILCINILCGIYILVII